MLWRLLACVYVGMDDDSLGMSEDTLFVELVIRAFSGGEQINLILESGAWGVC